MVPSLAEVSSSSSSSTTTTTASTSVDSRGSSSVRQQQESRRLQRKQQQQRQQHSSYYFVRRNRQRQPLSSSWLVVTVFFLLFISTSILQQVEAQRRRQPYECFQSSREEVGCLDTRDGSGSLCEFSVCLLQQECCTVSWDDTCVTIAQDECQFLVEVPLEPTFPAGNNDTTTETAEQQQEQDDDTFVDASTLNVNCLSRHCNEHSECCGIPACFDVIKRICIQEAEDGGGGAAGLPQSTVQLQQQNQR